MENSSLCAIFFSWTAVSFLAVKKDRGQKQFLLKDLPTFPQAWDMPRTQL